jgi:hypothetical protein
MSLTRDIYAIEKGFDLIKESLDGTRQLLLQVDQITKQVWFVLNMLKAESKTLSAVNVEIQDKLKGMKSPNCRAKLLRKIKDLELAEEFTNNSRTMLRITDKGREELGE